MRLNKVAPANYANSCSGNDVGGEVEDVVKVDSGADDIVKKEQAVLDFVFNPRKKCDDMGCVMELEMAYENKDIKDYQRLVAMVLCHDGIASAEKLDIFLEIVPEWAIRVFLDNPDCFYISNQDVVNKVKHFLENKIYHNEKEWGDLYSTNPECFEARSQDVLNRLEMKVKNGSPLQEGDSGVDTGSEKDSVDELPFIIDKLV